MAETLSQSVRVSEQETVFTIPPSQELQIVREAMDFVFDELGRMCTAASAENGPDQLVYRSPLSPLSETFAQTDLRSLANQASFDLPEAA